MKKFFLLVAAIGALYHFKPELFHGLWAHGAFDSGGKPQVLLFTARNCSGFCERAVQSLKSRGLAFEEIPLDDNKENVSRYESLGGNGTIPYLSVGRLNVPGFDGAMYASALAQSYGDKSLTPLERRYFSRHFRPDGAPRVYMYGASWCNFCKLQREELTKRGVPLEEVDVERAADRTVMEETMGIYGFPVIYVGYVRVTNTRTVDPVLEAMKTAGGRRM